MNCDGFPHLAAVQVAASVPIWFTWYLPACVLGVSVAAYIARLTRSAMLEVLSRDFILVARALGVREN